MYFIARSWRAETSSAKVMSIGAQVAAIKRLNEAAHGGSGAMLKSLSIKNFRLFRKLEVDSLNRVNLIAGENNSGKTALLEALYLLFGDVRSFMDFPSALRSSFETDQTRGHVPVFADEFENFWLWLFNQRNLRRPIEIEGVGDDDTALEDTYLVKLSDEGSRDSTGFAFDYFKDGRKVSSSAVSKGDGATGSDKPAKPGTERPSLADRVKSIAREKAADSGWPKLVTFSTNPSSPTEDAEYFNQIAAKRGGEKRLVKLLQVVEPRLQDLKYLKLASQPLVYADVGMEDLIPTTQLGQGFTRLLRLYSETLVGRAKIVLIDEIENGIHYSAMPKVWKGIAAIAQQEDLQFFATTHSYECIRSAHEAFSSEGSYDLALHRLERVKDEIRVVTYDKSTLETSFEMNLEVR